MEDGKYILWDSLTLPFNFKDKKMDNAIYYLQSVHLSLNTGGNKSRP